MRILLAIDDSKFSEAAVETVIEQARPHGTEVRILHVVESPPLLVARELGGYEPALENALESQKQHAESARREGRGIAPCPRSKRDCGSRDGRPEVKNPRRRRRVACRLDRTWLTRTEGSKPFSDGRCIRRGSPARLLFGGDRQDLSCKRKELKTGIGTIQGRPGQAS